MVIVCTLVLDAFSPYRPEMSEAGAGEVVVAAAEEVSRTACFGGSVVALRHKSLVLDCTMSFVAFLPPQVCECEAVHVSADLALHPSLSLALARSLRPRTARCQ
jgi:hypothetical protein